MKGLNHLCYHCMRIADEGDSVCPYCGAAMNLKPQYTYELRRGTILKEDRYLVGDVLGRGGLGITYIGLDLLGERRVAVKEFFLGERSTRASITANVVQYDLEDEQEQVLQWKEAFERKGRELAQLNDATGIVRVRDVFEENETAYIVMEFADEETLSEYIERRGDRSGLSEMIDRELQIEQPAGVERPSEPEKPARFEIPSVPGNPAGSGMPVRLEKPGRPAKPAKPEKLDKPAKPLKPDKIKQPKAEKPSKPEKPAGPEKPVRPAKPAKPDKAPKDRKTDRRDISVVKLVITVGAIIAVAVVAFVVILGIRAYKSIPREFPPYGPEIIVADSSEESQASEDSETALGLPHRSYYADAEGNRESLYAEYTYDPASRLKAVTLYNRDGSVYQTREITYGRDGSRTVTQRNYMGDMYSETYEEYDFTGREILYRYTDENGILTETDEYEYGEDGRLSATTRRDTDGQVVLAARYEYSEASGIETWYYPDGRVSNWNLDTYDDYGNIAASVIIYPGTSGDDPAALDNHRGHRWEAEYDRDGYRTLFKQYDSDDALLSWTEFAYNPVHELACIKSFNADGTLASVQYWIDE